MKLLGLVRKTINLSGMYGICGVLDFVNARSCRSSEELDKDKDQKLDYREFAALFQPPDWQIVILPDSDRVSGSRFVCSSTRTGNLVAAMTLGELT